MPTSATEAAGTAGDRPFPAYIPPPPPPYVAARVHYVAADTDGRPVCRAALVTEVDPADPYLVGVCAFFPVGVGAVPLSAGGVEPNFVDHRDVGSWHWPAADLEPSTSREGSPA